MFKQWQKICKALQAVKAAKFIYLLHMNLFKYFAPCKGMSIKGHI